MGLFSSKIRVHSQSISQRMLSDDEFISSPKYAITTKRHHNILIDKIDLQESVFQDTLRKRVLSSTPSKFNKAYNMAKNTGNYVFGLPTAYKIHDPIDTLKQATIKYLEDQTKKKVTALYFYVGDKRHIHYGYEKLIKDYDYNPITKTLRIQNQEAIIKSASIQLAPHTKEEYTAELLDYSYSWFDGTNTLNYVDGNRDELIINYGIQIKVENEIKPTLVINTCLENIITGYTQHNANVIIRVNNQTFDIQADDKGYFTHTFTGLNTNDAISITVSNKYRLSTDVSITYPYINDNPATKGQAVTYTMQERTGTLNIDLSDVNPALIDDREISSQNYEDHIQMAYQTTDGIFFFSYGLSQGITELDGAFRVYASDGKYYPRIYVRTDGTDTINSRDNARKKHTEAICKKLGLSLSDLTGELRKGIGNEYDKVHSMYLGLSVGIKEAATDSLIAKYLYHYFDDLANHSKQMTDDDGNEYLEGRSIQIADNYSSTTISYSSMVVETKVGKLTDVGKYKLIIEQNRTTRKDIFGSFKKDENTYSYRLIKQINNKQYEQIIIIGLKTTHHFADRAEGHWGFDENMSIPVDGDIVKKFNIKDREFLFNKALRVQILVRYTTKQKWYQRGVFKFVVAIVGIVISVVSVGMDGGTGAMMVMAALKAVAVGVAISIVIDLSIKIAVKLGLSEKVIGAIAVIATIAAIYFGNGKSFNNLKALDAIKALNKGFDVYNKAMNLRMQDFKKEYDAYMANMKDKYDRLKEAQQLLNTGVASPQAELMMKPISSYVFNNEVNLGETPESFYNKSMMYDVSEIVMTSIDDFVEHSMYIPIQRYKPYESESVEDVLLIT